MEKVIVHAHFHTGHRHLGYSRSCRHTHGHTWKGSILVSCEEFPRDELDMSLDFGDLKGIMRFLDHKMLIVPSDKAFLDEEHFEPEGVVVLEGNGPTSENVGLYIWEKTAEHIRSKFPGRGIEYTIEVVVQETDNNIFVLERAATI